MRYKLKYELFQLENKNGIITKKVLKREQPVSKSKRCGKIFDTRVQSESRNEYGYAYHVKRMYKIEIYTKNKERLCITVQSDLKIVGKLAHHGQLPNSTF